MSGDDKEWTSSPCVMRQNEWEVININIQVLLEHWTYLPNLALFFSVKIELWIHFGFKLLYDFLETLFTYAILSSLLEPMVLSLWSCLMMHQNRRSQNMHNGILGHTSFYAMPVQLQEIEFQLCNSTVHDRELQNSKKHISCSWKSYRKIGICVCLCACVCVCVVSQHPNQCFDWRCFHFHLWTCSE